MCFFELNVFFFESCKNSVWSLKMNSSVTNTQVAICIHV